jgi:hypothetical protein
MKIINDYYDNIKAGGHPFEDAAIFHCCFEINIHSLTATAKRAESFSTVCP